MSALIKPALLRGSKLILRSLELDLQLNEKYSSAISSIPTRMLDLLIVTHNPSQTWKRISNIGAHVCYSFFRPLRRIGYDRQGSSRTIDVILHRGRPAQPDRTDNFSVHLDGKASAPRCYTRKIGDAGQKRRVALDEVEKVLR